MSDESNAERLNALFSGLDRAYGVFKILHKNESKNGKLEGRAETIRGSVNAALWLDHILGKQGVGIIPIKDNSTCSFAAIDIDINDINHNDLEEKIIKMDLPLLVCKSKSGGAHLFCFFKEPIKAEIVRKYMAEWATALGYPSVEIFPKQAALAGKDDVGNWLNMPYFGGTRVAVIEGKEIDLVTFLDLAEGMRLTKAELEEITIHQDEGLEEAPPCLQVLCSSGFPEGSRNKGLFNLGVYARLRYSEKWNDMLDGLNREYMKPPLSSKEVHTLTKSLNRKQYFYSCNEYPIVDHCNKQLCFMRKYGIGDGPDEPNVVIGSLVKMMTDPPKWFIDVDGFRLELETDDLLNQHKFRKKCVEKVNKYPTPIKSIKWEKLVAKKIEQCEVIDAPEDASERGQFLFLVNEFLDKASDNLEDILRGYPHVDGDLVTFRSSDLQAYLKRAKFLNFKSRDMFAVLREDRKTTSKQMMIKGKNVRVWQCFFNVSTQQEKFSIPTIEDLEDF